MLLQIDVWAQTAGLGHVTRQIALMRALIHRRLTDTTHIAFFVDADVAIQQTVANAGMKFFVRPTQLEQAAQAMQRRWRARPPDLFVLDSVAYDRVPAVAALLEQENIVSLAVIDDPLNRAVNADLVVNPLPTLTNAPPPLSAARAKKMTAPKYLLGKDFFILAPEFAEWHGRPRSFPERATRAFAFFGGADGNNFTPIFFDVAQQLHDIEWTLLIGALYPHTQWALQALRERKLPITPVFGIPSMGQIFSETDLALVAAGNTLVEAAAAGAPAIAFAQNEIQMENANYFAKTCQLPCLGLYNTFGANETINAIRSLSENRAARAELSRALKMQIDGRAAMRVAEAVAAYCARQNGA